MVEVEFHANQEHEENEANLAEHREGLGGDGIEDFLKRPGKETPENGWAEYQSSGNFTTNLWLAHELEHPAKQARRHDDDDNLDNDSKEQMLCRGADW
jgi:hypothetical protein